VIDKLSADNEDVIKVCAAKEENDTESTFYYLSLLTSFGPIGTYVTLDVDGSRDVFVNS
jgi:hypothetical protein